MGLFGNIKNWVTQQYNQDKQGLQPIGNAISSVLNSLAYKNPTSAPTNQQILQGPSANVSKPLTYNTPNNSSFSNIGGATYDQFGNPTNQQANTQYANTQNSNFATGNPISASSQNAQLTSLGGNAGQPLNYNGQTIGGYDSGGNPYLFGNYAQSTQSAPDIQAPNPDSTTPSTSLGTSPTNSDIALRLQKHLDSLDTMFSNLSSLGTVPQSEIDLQNKVASDQAAMTGLGYQAQGLWNPDNQTIALPFLTGQAQSKMVSAGLQTSIDQAALAYAQGNRQFAFNSAKDIYNAARNNLQDTLNIYTQTAPQNLATNYNPSTGALNAVMRNPLTGEQYTASLGNIGAQRSFTSTNIATDPYNGGALTFVGTTADGQIVSYPLSGGIGGSQGGSFGSTSQGGFNGQFNSSPTGLTTPAAVNNNPGNLRDPQTGQWQKFSTPQEGFQALMNDIQLKQTGKSRTGLNGNSTLAQFTSVYAPASDGNDPIGYANTIAKQLGISTNTPIGQIPTAQLAAAVAQHEDGRYWAALTSGQSNAVSNIAPVAQRYVETLQGIPGSEYINSDRVPQVLQNGIRSMTAGVVPVLTTPEVGTVKSISQTYNNLETMRGYANQVLGSGAVGRIGSSISNWFDKTFQPNTSDAQIVAKFNSFREAAIKNIQALGASGRLNQTEIDTAVNNLPTIYDSKQFANSKLDQVQTFLQNALQQIIPNAQLASNVPVNSSGSVDYTSILNQLAGQ